MELFNFGCRCRGRLQFHLWYNGVDYVVARDIEEARKVAIDAMGYEKDEADGFSGWFVVVPHRKITIEEDEDVITTLTAEKWVGEIGKPEYLGNTEGP